MERRKSKDFVKVFAIALPLAFAGMFLVERLAVNTTPSTVHRVFFVTGGKIKKGDYVLFTLDGERVKFYKGKKVIKQVVCDEGDELMTLGKAFYCNGKLIGYAKDRTSKGEPLEQFVWSGKIPEGKAFVMGTHPNSYDSRYWGFIDKKEARRVVALW